jgi:hypothetical protein
MHVGTASCIVFSGVAKGLMLIVLFGVALHYWWVSRQPRWQAVKFDNGQWWLYDGEEWKAFSLFANSSLMDKLVVLNFNNEWSLFNLYVWPDSTSSRQFRHLRILLKHGVDMSS